MNSLSLKSMPTAMRFKNTSARKDSRTWSRRWKRAH
ncbi:unnamed protein product [Rhizoctonia solani]|uniref:Uncharacterized protein n=1 Tax=Rhizoctonia solani TaxID=456999 RepID=A0A8H2X9B7_9AGAM|nr:unnamed protein product [Rhizoctonia solani]